LCKDGKKIQGLLPLPKEEKRRHAPIFSFSTSDEVGKREKGGRGGGSGKHRLPTCVKEGSEKEGGRGKERYKTITSS